MTKQWKCGKQPGLFILYDLGYGRSYLYKRVSMSLAFARILVFTAVVEGAILIIVSTRVHIGIWYSHSRKKVTCVRYQ